MNGPKRYGLRRPKDRYYFRIEGHWPNGYVGGASVIGRRSKIQCMKEMYADGATSVHASKVRVAS